MSDLQYLSLSLSLSLYINMVKSSLIAASLATAVSVAMAQSGKFYLAHIKKNRILIFQIATPTAVSDITLPTAIPSNLSGLPSGVADAVSSLIKNPAGINSYISVVSLIEPVYIDRLIDKMTNRPLNKSVNCLLNTRLQLTLHCRPLASL